GQLASVQLVQGEFWSTQAVSQQLSDNLVAAHRGTIYDRNMTVLAESMQVWTVIMSPSNIEDEAARVLIADEVSKILNVDRDKLYAKTTKTKSQYEKVATQIEYPTVEKLMAWVEKNKDAAGGVFRVITDYKRTYPYGSLASTVIGFIGTDYYGLYGLEAEYNDTLSGVAGRIVTAQNGVGNDMPVSLTYEKTVDAEDGKRLVLTLDVNIQHYAEKHLETAVIETGATNRGVCIVMDVKTGAVLAMAVKGDFDLNDPWEIKDPTVLEQLKLLSGDELDEAMVAARQEQWVNKAVSDFYEPGSVFKVYTSCMALEEGIATMNSSFYCPGYATVSGQTINCWYTAGHGAQTFADIISHSCNPAFISLGVGLGGERFYKYFVGFGFTQPTGIDTLSEGVVTKSLYHGIDMTDLDVATSSMGQTFKITPIQMITALSAVANGGYLMQPYLVSQVLDADGNVLRTTKPTVKRQVVSTETTAQVISMMAAAVNGGGSKNVYVPGYRVAGKSGTSDKTETRQSITENQVWGSFGTFAPADNPAIAVLTIIDEPHSSNRYGSYVAGPVCQKVLAETLPYLGVEPEYTEEELANLSTVTPNVVDKDLSTAATILNNNGLTYYTEGNGT
ncbi:MAG: stage V sporulation protein D, partial [Clostridia bacterium]|nr:stage V sporulation protein D [Clostridia bacterium]